MAKSAAYRWWTGFGEQAKRKPKPKKKSKGISNKQAKFLAALQRKAGERYAGNGMSSAQASKEIDRLLHPVKVTRVALDREWEERAARDE